MGGGISTIAFGLHDDRHRQRLHGRTQLGHRRARRGRRQRRRRLGRRPCQDPRGTLTVSGTTVDHNMAKGGDGATAATAWAVACTTTPREPDAHGHHDRIQPRPGGEAAAAAATAGHRRRGLRPRDVQLRRHHRHQEEPRLHQQRQHRTLIGPWSLILSPWCSASPPRMVARPSHQGRGTWDGWWGGLRLR